MATQVQLRRGTATENNSFTGAQGELTFDTTNKRVRIHDGATAGGFELKTENSSGDTLFADNEKAIFGAGSDLQIYHDGSNSYIQDAGTGGLYLKANSDFYVQSQGSDETFIQAASNAFVKLFYNGSEKLATTSTGVDITGTLTSDGLTVDGNVGIGASSVTAGFVLEGVGDARFGDVAGDDAVEIGWSGGGSYAFVQAFDRGATAQRDLVLNSSLRIDSSGNVGIGKVPTASLDVLAPSNQEPLILGVTTNSFGYATFRNAAGSDVGYFGLGGGAVVASGSVSDFAVRSQGNLLFSSGGSTERMRIDSSGNLLVGKTTSDGFLVGHEMRPASFAVHTVSGGVALYTRRIGSGTNDDGDIQVFQNNDGTVGSIGSSSGTFQLVANTNLTYKGNVHTFDNAAGSTEYMRLDASGNLLVGKTSAGIANAGSEFSSTGRAFFTFDNGGPLQLNRLNGDGDIIELHKDGTEVGSIGVTSSRIYAGTGDTGLFFNDQLDSIDPWNTSSNAARDAAIDLGDGTRRFKDLYLSGSIEIENGTGNVGVGKQALNSNTGSNNTAVGYQAGYTNSTGERNAYLGRLAGYYSTGTSNTFVGDGAGNQMQSGNRNTIIGRYNGNESGLDIRTSSNNIVLADGDGNARGYINGSGYLKMRSVDAGFYNSAGAYHEFNHNNSGSNAVIIHEQNVNYTNYSLYMQNARTNSANYGFILASSGGGTDNEFKLRGDGNAYADGSWNGGGADYAEYFEWDDGNAANEDRRGFSVVLVNNNMRKATADDDASSIIGVVSGNPSVVGDTDIGAWKHKYQRDDYGTYQRDENDERILNPDYNPDQEYTSREDRPEWDTVGLMGKLRIRKGQPTGSNWIKMRDVSDTVEEWLVR